MKILNVWNVVRPVAASALLLFCCSWGLQALGQFIDPAFSILASKDLGKIVFTSLIFVVLGGFVATRPAPFGRMWLRDNLSFLVRPGRWLPSFFGFFVPFFALHWALLIILVFFGYAGFTPSWGNLSLALVGKLAFGLFATFMLALTEEVIFRGTLYPYFQQFMRPLTAALTTSLLFMLVHDLANPLRLITSQWRLGLGLFLLGLLLNLVRIVTGKLYTGMGIHAGLVYVKVILRKARFLVFLPDAALPWLLSSDLRQAPLVHLMFSAIIVTLVAWKWQELTSQS